MTSELNDDEPQNDQEMKDMVKSEITKVNFAYKFIPGVSSSSLGIYVAKKAGLNERVIEIAQRKASQFNDKLFGIVSKFN